MMTQVRSNWGLVVTRGVVAAVLALGVHHMLLPGVASAQTSTGGIRGIVRDTTGGVLDGVTVEATSPALIGGPSVEVTNQQGLYRFERLPIGSYQIKVTRGGFQQVIREGLQVEVGRTMDVDMVMGIGAVEESLTISAAAPVVDSLHAGTSTNFGQQLMDELPSARLSWFNTVGFASGVRSDLENFTSARFIFFGTGSDQNVYQFEGIDYNAPAGGGDTMWHRPNADSIAEVQVQSVGASAEAAGFMGGIVNEILKSGSNTWRGRAGYFYIGRWLTDNNTPEARFPFKIGYMSDLTGEYGGPIIRDKLWVIGMVERFDNHQVQVGVPLQNGPKSNRTKPTFKITAKVSDRDSLDFAYTDNYFRAAGQTSALQPPITGTRSVGNNPIFAAHWWRTIGTKTVFELRGGGIWEPNQRGVPNSKDFNTSGRVDIGTGQSSVNVPSIGGTIFKNHSIYATVSHYADDLIKGSHDFRFGVQVAPAVTSLSWTKVIDDTQFFDLNGAPYYALKRNPRAVTGRTRSFAGFLQDNWTLTNRLTANLGLRFDHSAGDVPEANQYDAQGKKTGVEYSGLPGTLIEFNDVSPRLGLTFKIDRLGKTVAKAAVGRYYGRLHHTLFRDTSPGNSVSEYFFFNPATGQYDIPFRSVVPNANYGIDPNLSNQYTDQFYVGVERELFPGLAMEVFFVVKKEQNFIRVRDVGGTYVAQDIVDTFRGATQTLTVYNRISASSQSRYLTTNRNDFRQDYKTAVVQVNKRMTNGWQLQGSYQWERAVGNNTGAIGLGTQDFSNVGVNGFGADPNDLTNSYGPFYTNSPHTLRVSAAFRLPFDVNVGVQESFETGRPYGRLITVRTLGQGARNILVEPRGAERLSSANNLQLRVGKDFRPREEQRLRVSLDIYNVFNVDTPLTVRNNSSQGEALFGRTLSVFTPRRAQIGIRYEF